MSYKVCSVVNLTQSSVSNNNNRRCWLGRAHELSRSLQALLLVLPSIHSPWSRGWEATFLPIPFSPSSVFVYDSCFAKTARDCPCFFEPIIKHDNRGRIKSGGKVQERNEGKSFWKDSEVIQQGTVTEKKKSELKPNNKRHPVDPLRYINAAAFPSVPWSSKWKTSHLQSWLPHCVKHSAIKLMWRKWIHFIPGGTLFCFNRVAYHGL